MENLEDNFSKRILIIHTGLVITLFFYSSRWYNGNVQGKWCVFHQAQLFSRDGLINRIILWYQGHKSQLRRMNYNTGNYIQYIHHLQVLWVQKAHWFFESHSKRSNKDSE